MIMSDTTNMPLGTEPEKKPEAGSETEVQPAPAEPAAPAAPAQA
jgi:hypothetical protein